MGTRRPRLRVGTMSISQMLKANLASSKWLLHHHNRPSLPQVSYSQFIQLYSLPSRFPPSEESSCIGSSLRMSLFDIFQTVSFGLHHEHCAHHCTNQGAEREEIIGSKIRSSKKNRCCEGNNIVCKLTMLALSQLSIETHWKK
jgi:hypothetical protein